jgi:hypothetical protein
MKFCTSRRFFPPQRNRPTHKTLFFK